MKWCSSEYVKNFCQVKEIEVVFLTGKFYILLKILHCLLCSGLRDIPCGMSKVTPKELIALINYVNKHIKRTIYKLMNK